MKTLSLIPAAKGCRPPPPNVLAKTNGPTCIGCGTQPRPGELQAAGCAAAVGMWDMSLIKQHAVNKGVFSAQEVDDAEREYKRYIILSFLAQPPPIGERVDQMWHQHILFTQDYAEFCQVTGGYFLHHRPSILGDNGPQLTFDGYRARWGKPSDYWWNSSQPCSADRCGGNPPN